MNYELIKREAKKHKLSVKDLLVLSPNNDPFYVGSKGQMEKAKFFAKCYKQMGSPDKVHIRRVHYWLVSRSDVKKPDGSRYLNTEKDWSFLTMCAKYARYAELVPVENMIDRRNPDPIINATNWEDDTPEQVKSNTDAEEIIRGIVSNFYCYNPSNTQPYLMELWCEKSTMNDILEPLGSTYGINVVTGLGELSITAVYQLVERFKESQKPVRIFYISDFDPAGECMPVSISRKIEYFMRQDNWDSDIKLKPVMLTSEQCGRFDLPRTPIKSTEGRKESFEERHGSGATELDALEALYPGEMKNIIERDIKTYFDVEAWNSAIKKNKEIRGIVQDFLKDKVINILEKLDLTEHDNYQTKRGKLVKENGEWLYDSNRDYVEQLNVYKSHKE